MASTQDDMSEAAGRKAERAEIVVWLRQAAADEPSDSNQYAQVAADAFNEGEDTFEHGEHGGKTP